MKLSTNNALQILSAPPGHGAFGGIGTFDGLGDENLKALFNLCSFKYMGASEYEWGVSPKLLIKIAQNRETYNLHEVSIKKKKFFVLIQNERLKDYSELLDKFTNSNRARDFSGLKDVIEGKNKDYLGWIDLYGEAMFFVDEKMAKGFNKWLHMEEPAVP